MVRPSEYLHTLHKWLDVSLDDGRVDVVERFGRRKGYVEDREQGDKSRVYFVTTSASLGGGNAKHKGH